MALFKYMKDTQRLLRDGSMNIIDPGDIIEYVNDARRQVALRAQCIRILTNISGAIISANVTNGGSGYTAPTVVITPPDFPSGQPGFPNGAQATAAAQQIGGVISTVEITYGGSGYFEPILTIIDPTGVGATVVPSVSKINALNFAQEVYKFSDVDLSPFPGIGEITAVISASVIFDNYRYMLPMYSFTEYQAKVRQYPFQYQYVPAICAQFGQGSGGSLYVYPLPSQTYQWEWDCVCVPQDLFTDQDVDALPPPWQDCVKFYAAHLAFLEMQNYNSAQAMLNYFTQQMLIAGKAARVSRAVNVYGRY